MTDERTGVYPGTFDPITNGHTDIIRRATKVVDHLVVAVAENAGKAPLFSAAERLDVVKDEVTALGPEYSERIEIVSFGNLLVNFAQSIGATVIIRGLRAVSDFEYEFQMVGMNARLNPEIETVFLMASDKHQFISSKLVKEIGELGGDISQFVSAPVAVSVMARLAGDKS
jgi:pantetheine-phosphate adenylyltransferase